MHKMVLVAFELASIVRELLTMLSPINTAG